MIRNNMGGELQQLDRAKEAIVQYRQQNGAFKTVDDLSRIPGLDFKKISAKKALVQF